MINLYSWKDNPLKVVKDPQNPNPKINLYLLETGNELINPNKKQPIILTTKILSICHLIKAAGKDTIEIKKTWFVFKKLFIYLPNRRPNEKDNTPDIKEIIDNLNAL